MKQPNLTKQQIKAALKLATDREIAAELGYRKRPICGHSRPEPDTCKLCKERLRLREYRARINEK
jgi:hypothetical protein